MLDLHELIRAGRSKKAASWITDPFRSVICNFLWPYFRSLLITSENFHRELQDSHRELQERQDQLTNDFAKIIIAHTELRSELAAVVNGQVCVERAGDVPRKAGYLFVLSSSCQMYSGTGTAVFDWIRHAKSHFQFSVLMDMQNSENFDITAKFCRDHGLQLHGSAPFVMPGCPDSGVKDIAIHLRRHRYDYIECVSWANTSTNMGVLASKPADTKLVFTPHSQPVWTLPGHSRFFLTSTIFDRMLKYADAVFVDSPLEQKLPEFSGARSENIHFVPLGVDTAKFRNADTHVPYQVICVCDCREPRKRIDVLLTAFSMALDMQPKLQLTLAGKGSEAVSIPDNATKNVSLLGYVDSEQLVRLYQNAALFVLMSDYEAFGLPIAEALCCGTPVLITEQDALVGLFGDLPGVNWTQNTDIRLTAEKIAMFAAGGFSFRSIAKAASARFAFENTYGKKRDILLSIRGAALASK
jgi:glycosyltransferase involved in cell wall biosynthesis